MEQRLAPRCHHPGPLTSRNECLSDTFKEGSSSLFQCSSARQLVPNGIESHSRKTPPLCNALVFSSRRLGLVRGGVLPLQIVQKAPSSPILSGASFCIFTYLPVAWFHMNSFPEDSLGTVWLQDESYSPIPVFVRVFPQPPNVQRVHGHLCFLWSNRIFGPG